jgi:precorrin-6B C5,15-methyltransferase / cobalt-precorrin-6B C5,C15-methyltransferase
VTTVSGPRLAVVGVVGGEVFGAEARRLVEGADLLVGARRHLDRFSRTAAAQERLELDGSLRDLDAALSARGAGRRVCVLASGDPGFFGIVRALRERCGPEDLEIHPAPSSVSLAWAAAGLAWDDADVVSAHGRPWEAALAAVARSSKVAVLTAPANPPEALGKELLSRGCRDRAIVVASRLGEADERVVRTDLQGLAEGSFDPLSVVLVVTGQPRQDGPSISWGRDEASFDHRDGMITKSEVRSVVLGKLELPRSGVLWDVGAGSGSVGIEAATIAPELRVYAVERSAADAARVATNSTVAGVADRVEVVEAEAPSVFDVLPDPDRVFVGGGGLDAMTAAWDRLRLGGVLVATFVLLDRAVEAFAVLGNMCQIHVDRAVAVGRGGPGSGFRLAPLNPVLICWGRR